MSTLLAALALGLACALPQGGDEDRGIGAALAELRSEDAATRERAQRRLAAELCPEDFPEVARAAREADPEARRRLVDALSSDDRHLGLIVLLLSEQDRGPLEVGEEAFGELVVRWCPGAADEPAGLGEVEEAMRHRSPGIFAVAAGSDTPRRRLERLDRLTDLGIPVVVTPDARADVVSTLEALEGTSWELFTSITEAAALSVGGIGRWEAEPPPAAWILVAGRGRARRESGLSLLRVWCLEVQRGGQQAPGAARAIAATTWPAGLAWLAGLWTQREHEGALAGLLHAAERGRAAPALLSAATREHVLSRAEERCASEPARAAAHARSLAQTAALAGRAGRVGELPDSWRELDSRRLRLRLIVLEGAGAQEPAALRDVVWGAHGHPPGVRLMALRVAARSGAAFDALEPPESTLLALVDARLEREAGDELVELLVATAVRPPALTPAWSVGPRSRFLFEWSLRARRAELGAELLRAARLEDPAEQRAWARALAAAARASGEAAVRAALGERAGGFEAVLALAGLATAEESASLAGRLLARAELGPDELRLLGALAACPAGVRVRTRLQEELQAAERLTRGSERVAALGEALGLAADQLRRSREDDVLERWARRIWRACRGEGHPLGEELGPRRFPGGARPRAVRIDNRERSL